MSKLGLLIAAGLLSLPGAAAAQNILMRRPIPHFVRPAPPAVVAFPHTGTWQEQSTFLRDYGNVIRTEVKKFIADNGREPSDIEEVARGSENLRRWRVGCPEGVCGPILSIQLSRSWRYSPRWNAPGEYDTLYIVAFLNTYPYESFCRAWAEANPYDPDIYNSGGHCSSYYENHITIKL